MRVFITGGAGFIGSNFIRLLLRERPEFELCCFDALTYAGKRATLQEIENHPRFQFIQGDIANSEQVLGAFKNFYPEALVNFAAETHVDRSIHGGAADFIRTNVAGVETLLSAARALKIPRLIQVSTDEVYGALPEVGGEPFSETTPFAPNSPYAASKAGGDLLCRAYERTYGLPVMVTHGSNTYGRWQFPEKLIPFFIRRALANETLPLYGDGGYVRDWIHVDDHCQAILAVIEKGVIGETYNIGAGVERKNIEIAKIILDELGKPESLISFVADRPGHDRRYSVSSAKIRAKLGWKPEYDNTRFESGLREVIRWYTMNKSWLEAVVDNSIKVNAHISV